MAIFRQLSQEAKSITEDSYPHLPRLVSNLGVRAIAQIRWRIVLPSIMAFLSAYLMLLAKRQRPTLLGLGKGWEVPGNVVNSIINGPGFYFGRLIPIPVPHVLNEALSYNGDRLLGVVLFWFLIGLSIERHVRRQALDSHHPKGAAALFALASLICGVFTWGGIAYVFCPSPNLSCWEQANSAPTVLSLVARYPLRLQHTMVLSASLWLLFFCGYFAKRAFAATRKTWLKPESLVRSRQLL
jgi:hypothetical protein